MVVFSFYAEVQKVLQRNVRDFTGVNGENAREYSAEKTAEFAFVLLPAT